MHQSYHFHKYQKKTWIFLNNADGYDNSVKSFSSNIFIHINVHIVLLGM